MNEIEPLLDEENRRPDGTARTGSDRGISAALLSRRILAFANAMSGYGFDAGPLHKRRAHLQEVVDENQPSNDSELQMLLGRELALHWQLQYLSLLGTRDPGEIDPDATMATSMKFSKLHLQYQAEYEKTLRKGVQKFVVENRGTVAQQNIYSSAQAPGTERSEKVIDGTASPSMPAPRRRGRPPKVRSNES